ncbi:MAG: hypothetical protein GY792_27555 [Gammaproteobacteria bacterium]|nr:hypothetical protein [Gammaproteobacteria bacterium]
MIEKSESNQLSLATAPILGQAPRRQWRQTPFRSPFGDIRVIEIPQVVSTILNDDSTLSYDAGTGKFYPHVESMSTGTVPRTQR